MKPSPSAYGFGSDSPKRHSAAAIYPPQRRHFARPVGACSTMWLMEIGDLWIYGFMDLWIYGFRDFGIYRFRDLGIWGFGSNPEIPTSHKSRNPEIYLKKYCSNHSRLCVMTARLDFGFDGPWPTPSKTL